MQPGIWQILSVTFRNNVAAWHLFKPSAVRTTTLLQGLFKALMMLGLFLPQSGMVGSAVMSCIAACRRAGLETGDPEHVHRSCAQRGHHTGGVTAAAMPFLGDLVIVYPAQLSMLQRCLTSCSRASGVVGRLVRNRCIAHKGLPSRK